MENKNDKESSFWKFLCKQGFFVIIVSCLVPFVINYVKYGRLEFETLPLSFLVALALSFCIWKVSRIKF